MNNIICIIFSIYFSATVIVTPRDLIKSRLQVPCDDLYGDRKHRKGLLKSDTINCLIQIWRQKGFLGLYRGYKVNYFSCT